MFRWSVLLLAVLASASVATGAWAAVGQWTISVGGGAGVPIGSFADANKADAGTGLQLGGAVDYMVTPTVACGIDGSYNRNKHGIEGTTEDLGGGIMYSYDKDRFNTWHVGAHGKYMIPVSGRTMQPFVRLGAGIYNMTEDWEYTYTDPSGSTVDSGKDKFGSRIGGSVGAGANFRATETVSFGVNADYNFLSMNKGKFGDSSASYLSFHGMVNFSLMPK
jgi:Outer membrane protein beta-barrel domain